MGRDVDDGVTLGLEACVGPIRNAFTRRARTDPDAAPLVIGSYLDSQMHGGRPDGQLGVLTAHGTLRTLDDVVGRGNISYKYFASGAGHDATYVSRVVPTVPSAGGITHRSRRYAVGGRSDRDDHSAGVVQALATQ